MRNKKCLVVIMILIHIFTILSIPVSSEVIHLKLRSDEETLTYIERYVNESDESEIVYRVASKKQIGSFTNRKSYVVFSLKPTGYIIYDEYSGIVEEMVLDNDNPYEKVVAGDIHYGGPMSYLVKKDKDFYNVIDGSKLSTDDIDYLYNREINTADNRKAIKGLPTSTEYHYISSYTYFTAMNPSETTVGKYIGSNYGNNVNGTCTQVACSILLGWYYDFVSPNFINNPNFIPSS